MKSKVQNSNVPLNDIQNEILQYYSVHSGSSAYQIYVENGLKKRIDYKTIRRCVNQLFEKGLIEISQENKHKAKRCKLSVNGIYCLILNNRVMHIRVIKAILENYSHNVLFNLFLYPYIGQSTILKIPDSAFFARISLYLHECCNKVKELFYKINHTYNSKNGYLTDQLFVWQNVPKFDYDTKKLRQFLKQKLSLDWIDKAEIKKTEDENAIKISHESNSLLISISSEKTKAILTIKGKKKYELLVRSSFDGYVVEIPTVPLDKAYLRIFWISHQMRVQEFIFSLISDYGTKWNTPAMKILAEDKKFLQVLENTKDGFDKRYALIIGNRKSYN